VIGRDRLQAVILRLEDRSLAHLLHEEGKARPPQQTFGVAHRLVEPAGTQQKQRLCSAQEAVGLEQTGQAQVVVTVHVGEEYRAYPRQAHRPHQLPLGPFAAIDQQPLSPAGQQDGRGPTVDGRRGTGGAQKHQVKVQEPLSAVLPALLPDEGRIAASRRGPWPLVGAFD